VRFMLNKSQQLLIYLQEKKQENNENLYQSL
jgi:hypothetical protein